MDVQKLVQKWKNYQINFRHVSDQLPLHFRHFSGFRNIQELPHFLLKIGFGSLATALVRSQVASKWNRNIVCTGFLWRFQFSLQFYIFDGSMQPIKYRVRQCVDWHVTSSSSSRVRRVESIEMDFEHDHVAYSAIIFYSSGTSINYVAVNIIVHHAPHGHMMCDDVSNSLL